MRRLIHGSGDILFLTLVAVLLALSFVLFNKENSSASTPGEPGTGEFRDMPVVDCSFTSSHLDKAKCVLDSYPLVDG